MTLQEYRRKRDFRATPEPDAEVGRRRRSRPAIFVVQLHQARARHYDFRLEVDGALKSWAVPKGPSLRAGEKRLAVEVEDHPLEYARFAGDIPSGHYGAGHVDIFDHGTWTPDSEPLAALAKGHLDFALQGDKLRGQWTLLRTQRPARQPQWLLWKRADAEARDAEADDLIDAPTPSATPVAPKPASRQSWRREALALPGARDRPLPAGFEPQLCVLQAAPPEGDDWLHETKWDGYRLLADLQQGRARLRSRNDLDWTRKLPDIAEAIESLPVASARLDGELIAVDAKGHSDFGALQRALESRSSHGLRYVVFDLPALADIDVRGVALVERKTLLEKLLGVAKNDRLIFSSHIIGHGGRVFAATQRNHLEGIVSKAVDAPYVAGRSATWLKIKHAQTDDFIVVGYTAPKGSRAGFGSLLLAAVEDGVLRYVGRVGSGFDADALVAIKRRLDGLRCVEAAVDLPVHVPFHAGAVRWVQPLLCAEVSFRGRAKEGLLRQASFVRLRDDKTMETKHMSRYAISALRTRKRAAHPVADEGEQPRVRSRAVAAEKTVELTHPQRVVFAGTDYTKQAVANYYRAVARWMLPELVRRPLSILRCPDGAGSACFFQKHHAAALGEHVASIALREKSGRRDDYLYVDDLRGVLDLVQMNVIEFHPWGARIDQPEQPDRLVFDLDPGPGVDWKALVQATREVRARLQDTGLQSFVRLSGGKGTHVVVPLAPVADWAQAKAFCEAFAQALATQRPLTWLATASKAQREGRIFLDWLRNTRGATSVASWSLRAREGAPVAMPLRWEELGRTSHAAAYDLGAAQRRAKSLRKDPWEGFADLQQTLPNFGA